MKRTPNLSRPAIKDPTEAFLAGADFHQQTDISEQSESNHNTRKMVRFTVNIAPDLMEKARWVAYWDRETLSAIVTASLEAEIARRERANGEPYKPNARPLKRGRPIQKAS